MELLDGIEMHDFTRSKWVSSDAREKWAPRVEKAATVYSQLEFLTLKNGLRNCYLTSISPENLDEEASAYAAEELVVLPIRRISSENGFSHTEESPGPGDDWRYRVVVAKTREDALALQEAYKQDDYHEIAKLLGYPECCASLYADVWSQGIFDPIWQTAKNTDSHKEVTETEVKLNDDICHRAFGGLRYIGLRFCPHFPCSFRCDSTREMMDKWVDVAEQEEVEGWKILDEILRWPVKWDCLKGVCLVSTPVFRISTSSMPCYPKYIVKKCGSKYPDLAPSGLEFPWKKPEETTWDPDLAIE